MLRRSAIRLSGVRRYPSSINSLTAMRSTASRLSSRARLRSTNGVQGDVVAFGLAALNRALENTAGTTAVHICFGYAAIIHVRPSGYSFLPELAGCSCAQISIETAQSSLDCSVLKQLPGKKIILGVIDLADPAVETPELVANRIRRALPFVDPRNLLIAPDCGMKYLPREAAFGKLQAMVAGAQMVRAQLEIGEGEG